MRLHYNSPFILTFTFLCVGAMILDNLTNGITTRYLFTVYPHMSFSNPLSYLRLFLYVLGHANWNHLINNLTFILLLGPILEEKYGTKQLLIMSLITAFITGILNNFFFTTGLLGASGIVFMLIVLSSAVNLRSGHIPLTFILIIFLFLGREVYFAMFRDSISQISHIIGGLCGGYFGFMKFKK
jgi:membrane associated rhomboid family serine protease